MSYGLTTWVETTEMTSARLQQFTDSIDWHRERISHPFDLDGSPIDSSAGIGKIEGYLFIDPGSYPGYAGAGLHFGQFRVNFPAGIFSELLFCRCQPASADNAAMSASISGEGAGGVTAFVWDSGGTAFSAFAVWVTAIGKLQPGVLP